MIRSSKLLLFASMIGAAAFGAIWGAPGWHHFRELCAALFVAAFLLSRVAGDWPLAAGFGVLYVAPALISELHGDYYWQFHVVWSAWMLGGLAARMDPFGWHLPERWRLPAAFWALILAVGWPLIVARECDFHYALLYAEEVPNSGVGGMPYFDAAWITNVVSILGLSLLIFDWLFERFGRAGTGEFRSRVLAPLGIGIVLASAVALYQGLVDISFLSGGHWAEHHRAPGTMMDADAFGALAGWWTIAFGALAASAAAPKRLRVFAAIGYVMAFGAMWASGTRMGLLGALIGIAVIVPVIFRGVWTRWSGRTRIAVAAAAIAIVAAGASERALFKTISPVTRAVDSIPTLTEGGIGRFFIEMLWNRGAPYGDASMQMLGESPLAGIGPGMFHVMFPDYALHLVNKRSPPDNAQNWYRHQLTELGIAGSLGWIALALSFAFVLVRAVARPGLEAEAWIVRGALLAIALICAMAMPTQDAADAITVPVFVFWFLSAVETPFLDRPLSRRRMRWLQTAAWAAAAVYVGATAYMSWTWFRPPMRALRGEWGYAYGLYDPEVIDGREARWTGRDAVSVMEAPRPWLALTYWTNRGDIAANPVQVRIWGDSTRLVRARLSSTEPKTVYWRVPDQSQGMHWDVFDHQKWMMLETSVDKVLRPRDFGASDDRELGIAVAWNFVDAPPPGATIAE